MLKEDLISLMDAYHNARIGIVSDVDIDNEKITMLIDNKNEVTCDLFFPNCHIYNEDKTAWGNINYPSKGDFVIIGFYKGQPEILQWVNGKKNLDDIYNNGKLKINRIKDSEDTDTSLDEKLKIGEVLLRSIGFGDIFFDKFGNIILDSSKEFIFRIGDRDNDNKISSPETTLKIGKIKNDSDGNEKLDSDDKKIKLELIHNDDYKLSLNEDGKWHLENTNADIIINADGEMELDNGNSSIVLQTDGKVVINGGNVKVAREGDPIKSNSTLDATFWTYIQSHTHVGVTAGAGVTGPPSPPTPTSLDGDIDDGNDDLLSN